MTVALVGGAGFVGRAVREELLARGTPFVVIDKDDVNLTTPSAADALTHAFAAHRVDVVVHLAARVNPATRRERAEMRRLHVHGTEAVMEAVQARRISRVVLVSSATVYGAWATNPVPLREEHPARPNPGFWYGEDKLEQERIVLRAQPGATVLRPAIIYGPGARSYLTEILRRAPVLPALDGLRPPLQMVHVEDVASAIAMCVVAAVPGIFNVAPVDWLAFDDVARIVGRRVVAVPSALVRSPLDWLTRVLPPDLRAPASMLPYLTAPFVVDSAKLCAAGWRPRMGCAAALRSIL